jgi:glutaredoxin
MTHQIIIYSLHNCPRCETTKRKLRDFKIPYEEVESDFKTIEYLQTITDQLTMPVIIMDGNVVDLETVISQSK